jgi:3-oxoacyl-[acyl-carrier protein] reductase
MSRIIVVVGGTSGIGKALVQRFASLGDHVFPIGKANCDITDPEQIDRYFKNFNEIDVLINNAAINYCKTIEDISLLEWNEVINTNLTSFFYIIKKCVPLMKAGSKIVNVSSIAGRSRSLVSGVHYTSSKSGLIGLTRQLALELGPIGININCVCPSQTMTPMLEKSMKEEQIKILEEKIPLRRIARISEIVAPIVFLCSEEASYIHGACIDINGGQL